MGTAVRLSVALGIVIVASWGRAGEVPLSDGGARVNPRALTAHMRFLADDHLEGRATGARGHELAALYVAAQFEALGLEPAGDAGTYYQQVPLMSAGVRGERCRLSWRGAGHGETLRYERDFIPTPSFHRDVNDVEAELVFVGYGIRAPELGHDDYAGADVKGKLVVVLSSAPRGFPNDQRAHYGQPLLKAQAAAARGAVGLLLLRQPDAERVLPWERLTHYARMPSMRWLDEHGRPADAPEELRASAALAPAAGERLLAAVGRNIDDVVAEAQTGGRGFAFGIKVRLHVESHRAELRSPNVVALRRGSDPDLAGEAVVLSAHLDHVGLGDPEHGDAIHNGAYDNASGVAGLLELARLSALAPPPRRSLLFLAVTGEERGLLGSDYYARHPTVPRLVADFNLDMITMFGPVSDVLAYGAEHSSLGADVERAARELGLELAPDPFPEQSLFVRSDHYSFVRQGIPAVSPFPGLKRVDPGVDGKAEMLAWVKGTYHTPRDDMSQRFDAAAGARVVDVTYLAARAVAQADDAPRWNDGDFFGDTFGRRGAPAGTPAR